jgi:phospholipid/cholesterol/gamma-HCH transport system substrate-binding protein
VKAETTADMMETLSVSNRNLTTITGNLKEITTAMRSGKGVFSLLLNDSNSAANLKRATMQLNRVLSELRTGAGKASSTLEKLEQFSSRMNEKGGLVDKLLSDTTVFPLLKHSLFIMEHGMDSLSEIIGSIRKSVSSADSVTGTVGLLLNDPNTAQHIASIVRNLDAASLKLSDDLEAVQHNFLLRGYFRKKAKQDNR